MSILLSDLLAQTNCITTKSLTLNPIITGISDKSYRIKTGNLFVAVRGYKYDGHNYIVEAVEKGAAAIVCDKPVNSSVPVIYVDDTRIALAELSNAWFNFPAETMNIIGVTASNGKTTTTFMIHHLLSSYFAKTGLIGTVVIEDGNAAYDADLTTPNSRELFELLAVMRDNRCSHVTMEVSSAGQEQHRVHGISYNIAAFNNVSREHIDFHGSFENYWHHKSKLIRNLNSKAIAVLNADEPLIMDLKEDTKADVVTYSLKNNSADILIDEIDLSNGFGSFRYKIPEKISRKNVCLNSCNFSAQLKVLGLHNIYNATSAITVAKLCGIPEDTIISALTTFRGVERRFQLIYDGKYKIIDDHFANAGNIDITLETLGLMVYNNLHLVLAIRGNRGRIVNGENAEMIVKWLPKLPVDKLYVTDSEEFVGEFDLVTSEERTAFLEVLDKAGVQYTHYSRLTEAILAVLQAVKPGDIILLGGPQGMDHAAHLIIPKVAEEHPVPERSEILGILKNRVAGSS